MSALHHLNYLALFHRVFIVSNQLPLPPSVWLDGPCPHCRLEGLYELARPELQSAEMDPSLRLHRVGVDGGGGEFERGFAVVFGHRLARLCEKENRLNCLGIAPQHDIRISKRE